MKFATFGFVASLCLVAVSAIAIDDQNIQYQSSFLQKGQCIADVVYKATNVFKQFKDGVKGCSGVITEKEQDILDAVDEVLKTSDEIARIYKTDCKGGQQKEYSCKKGISGPMIDFVANIIATGKSIIAVRKVPGEMTKCVYEASHVIGEYAVEFPDAIKTCIWSLL